MAHAVNAAAILGGTLPYLSPEVLAGRPAEEADDVWSLCVVLDEMVSGRHPFTGGDLEQVRQGSDHRGLAGGVDVLRGKGHYGHRSRKTTWWYAVGGELPGLRRGKSAAASKIEDGYHSAAARWRAIKMEACQRLSHRERNATPEPFRDLLIAMAGTVKMKSETG